MELGIEIGCFIEELLCLYDSMAIVLYVKKAYVLW